MISNTEIRIEILAIIASINKEIERARRFTRRCLKDSEITSLFRDTLVRKLRSSLSRLKTSDFSILMNACIKIVTWEKCLSRLIPHHEKTPVVDKTARKIIKFCHQIAYPLSKAKITTPSIAFDKETHEYFRDSQGHRTVVTRRPIISNERIGYESH